MQKEIKDFVFLVLQLSEALNMKTILFNAYVSLLYKIKYWAKLLSTENIILKNCYLEMLNTESKNWVNGVRDILFELGFINVWNEQTVNTHLLPIIKKKQILTKLNSLILLRYQ